MGTRADFYVKKGKKLAQADRIGSIAWDGYPEGIPDEVKSATTEKDFRTALAKMASEREDWTKPEDGWPWPWNSSSTTDYAYIFDGDRVTWWEEPVEEGQAPPMLKTEPEYPDMKSIQRVTLGKRSGVMVVSGPRR